MIMKQWLKVFITALNYIEKEKMKKKILYSWFPALIEDCEHQSSKTSSGCWR